MPALAAAPLLLAGAVAGGAAGVAGGALTMAAGAVAGCGIMITHPLSNKPVRVATDSLDERKRRGMGIPDAGMWTCEKVL